MNSIPTAVVPVLNRFDLLFQMLESIDYPIDNLLIIDNSNSLENINNVNFNSALDKTKIQILNMPANMGVSGSWNLGIKCFPHSPYWLFMSNDNHWEAGGLAEMQSLSSPDKLVMSNVAWNSFSLGSEVVKKIGLFDENYHPAYYEDTDYMERLRFADMMDCIVWSTAPVKQISTATTVTSSEQFFQRNINSNQSNYEYWSAKMNSDHTHLNCSPYNLQRRIDNEWL